MFKNGTKLFLYSGQKKLIYCNRCKASYKLFDFRPFAMEQSANSQILSIRYIKILTVMKMSS
ncbi:hypothetical protein AB834_00605 [PVC group bacterium (ex Bugula neritina AB1)]|nr:hypothetical protein AB834_00605 [PVC group bacterium (ex Bugula neritina AB1)]